MDQAATRARNGQRERSSLRPWVCLYGQGRCAWSRHRRRVEAATGLRRQSAEAESDSPGESSRTGDGHGVDRARTPAHGSTARRDRDGEVRWPAHYEADPDAVDQTAAGRDDVKRVAAHGRRDRRADCHGRRARSRHRGGIEVGRRPGR